MGSTPEAAQVREAMETVASFAHLKYIYLAAAARGCSIASVAPQTESGCIDDVEFLNENGRPFAAASVKSMLAWHCASVRRHRPATLQGGPRGLPGPRLS